MKAILTSSLGGSIKVNGKWRPSTLIEENGLLKRIQSIWMENAKVLMICASPNDYEKNDSVYGCLKEAFLMSGLSYSSFEMCDDRNEEIIERFGEMDVVILAGGHVPTQNAFLEKLGLKEKIKTYNGMVIALSAGSMNCAEVVYAGPELEGEAIDPNYKRWIPGLGLTKTNIFPHFQSLEGEILDGLRVIEDITYADSIGHEIIALNDGSYLVIDDGTETIYGEAYSIKDGVQKQICRDGESIVLEADRNVNLKRFWITTTETMTFDCGFQKEDNWFRYRAAAIIVEEDCVLFAGNEIDDYLYSIGGGVHVNETAEDAVIREVFEETGVHYEVDRLAVIHENFFDGNGGTLKGCKCHELSFYFLMKPRGTKELNSNSTTCGVKESMHWIPMEDLDKYKAFPTFLKEYLKDKPKELIHIVTNEREEHV